MRALLAICAFLLVAGCVSELDRLAPFPTADDGTCPPRFLPAGTLCLSQCTAGGTCDNGQQCVVTAGGAAVCLPSCGSGSCPGSLSCVDGVCSPSSTTGVDGGSIGCAGDRPCDAGGTGAPDLAGGRDGQMDMGLPTDPSTMCAPVAAGVVGWWPGDGNGNDIAGGANGTLGGGVSFAPGEVSQAFAFAGSTDVGYMSAPADNLPAGSSDLTIEFWLRFDSTGSASQFSFFAGWGNASAANEIFYVGAEGTSWPSSRAPMAYWPAR